MAAVAISTTSAVTLLPCPVPTSLLAASISERPSTNNKRLLRPQTRHRCGIHGLALRVAGAEAPRRPYPAPASA